MPASIPLHQIVTVSNYGFAIKIIDSENNSHEPLNYAHRDDYYVFGMIENGLVECSIDFKEYNLTKGDFILIMPGQMHQFHKAENLRAKLLITDKTYVSDSFRHVLDEAAIRHTRCKLNNSDIADLSQILNLIVKRSDNINAEYETTVSRNLIGAYVGIVSSIFMRYLKKSSDYTSRQRELYLIFKDLLITEIIHHRNPSYYADKMNISAVYLNEVIRKVCGISASEYIKREIILAAKRMLYYTSFSIKQIAESLGFDDPAYFSRLFSETAGVSPKTFRKNHV